MPLIKKPSKSAFKKNVETEMDANPGKDNRAQNLAIAYSVQRRAKKKPPVKMAEGGIAGWQRDPHRDPTDIEDDRATSTTPASVVDAIMRKRMQDQHMMAEGGMLEDDSEDQHGETHDTEDPNEFNDLNLEAAGKELYDENQLSPQPTDSNETGDSEEMSEENKQDMISMIRRKMRMKKGM